MKRIGFLLVAFLASFGAGLLTSRPVEGQSLMTPAAPKGAGYITKTAEAGLSGEFALSSLTDGVLKHASGTPARAVPGTDYVDPAGVSGGQTIKGGTASGDDLTLMSTNHATKGHILFGTSGYDEVNNRLGVGTASPQATVHTSSSGFEQFRFERAGTGYGSVGITSLITDSAADLIFDGGQASTGISFTVRTSGDAQVRAININRNGLVGFSTTSPTAMITLADAGNIAVGTGTGTTIGTATSQKIGFWNATPVVQYSTTGTATGFTAGAGTTATHLSTFTGNLGATAYTVGDIVLALKRAGIMAQ